MSGSSRFIERWNAISSSNWRAVVEANRIGAVLDQLLAQEIGLAIGQGRISALTRLGETERIATPGA